MTRVALLPGSTGTGTKSTPNPMPCFLHTPSCKGSLRHGSLWSSTPWDEPQALQTCPAQWPLSPRAIAFSRNHKPTRAGSQEQESRCLTWPVWFPAKGQLQLGFSLSLGRSKKHISVGQYLTGNLFMQAHCPHLCSVPPTRKCSAVATHTLCSPTLLCSTHPKSHIPLVKSRCALCHHLITPNHLPWTKRISAWLLTSPEVDFFKEKTSQRYHNSAMAEFKLPNYLDRVVGCQCKTPDCSVGHRLHNESTNALLSSSQLCS